MSQQDVQTLREGYEDFNRQDIPAVLERFDPQIEWNEPGGGRAPAGTFRGPQNIAEQVFSHIPENFDELRPEPDRFIDSGEHVVVIGHTSGARRRAERPSKFPLCTSGGCATARWCSSTTMSRWMSGPGPGAASGAPQ